MAATTVKENLMKKLAALVSLALATAGLVAASPASPAHAFVRNSVPTSITITPPTGLHRSSPPGVIGITVTADPSYTGEISGYYSCLVQLEGDRFHYTWAYTVDAVTGQGSFYAATTKTGTLDVTCSFIPSYRWSILQSSGPVTTTYTVVEP